MSKTKKALITGITGQDGSYLAELLLSKGYQVYGIQRRASLPNTNRVDHLYESEEKQNQNFFMMYGDLADSSNLVRIMHQVQPDEIYNLGAQSFVGFSFQVPVLKADVCGIGLRQLLQAACRVILRIKFY
mgnify:CR=1 FL=1